MPKWSKISCKKREIQLVPTLLGGQCFRWNEDSNVFTGVVHNTVWKLKQSEDYLFFKSYNAKNVPEREDVAFLKRYLRLNEDLESLYQFWSRRDPYFKESAGKFYGIRILKQDVIENIFSFICSSNNNISRITSMVEKLSEMFGSVILELDGKVYHSFPQVKNLTDPNVEDQLRKAGFGYRAKFIHRTACQIQEAGGKKWVDHLESLTYQDAKSELMNLPGIGAKVADCICLMSLSHLEAIPVDTHIFQIACKRYLPHLQGKKSVTEKVYNEIGDHFRNLFEKYAGWAHTVLFCADLKALNKNPKSRKRKKEHQEEEKLKND